MRTEYDEIDKSGKQGFTTYIFQGWNLTRGQIRHHSLPSAVSLSQQLPDPGYRNSCVSFRLPSPGVETGERKIKNGTDRRNESTNQKHLILFAASVEWRLCQNRRSETNDLAYLAGAWLWQTTVYTNTCDYTREYTLAHTQPVALSHTRTYKYSRTATWNILWGGWLTFGARSHIRRNPRMVPFGFLFPSFLFLEGAISGRHY